MCSQQHEQQVPILDLPMPRVPPEKGGLVEAYPSRSVTGGVAFSKLRGSRGAQKSKGSDQLQRPRFDTT